MIGRMRQDTRYVQGYIDRGQLIPAGTYECSEQLTIPSDYVARAEAQGRRPDPGGWFKFSEDPGVNLTKGGSLYGALSGGVQHPAFCDPSRGFPMAGNLSGPELAAP